MANPFLDGYRPRYERNLEQSGRLDRSRKSLFTFLFADAAESDERVNAESSPSATAKDKLFSFLFAEAPAIDKRVNAESSAPATAKDKLLSFLFAEAAEDHERVNAASDTSAIKTESVELLVKAAFSTELVEHGDTKGQESWNLSQTTVELIREAAAALHPDVDRQRARTAKANQRAVAILDLWALLLPAPVSSEILGDYLEDIHRRALAGQGRAKIYVRMLATIFWTCVNAIGILLKEIGSRKAA